MMSLSSNPPSTFDEVRAFLSGHTPVPSRPGQDGWLVAAAALCDAARSAPGVAGLTSSATFQTRGRGAAVHGIALSLSLGGDANAAVGLILTETAVGNRTHLADTLAEVEARMQDAWEKLETGMALRLVLHVTSVG